MNKGELIERLSGKLGDSKLSSKAVDAVIDEIEHAVSSGEKVNISGFGVFEKRERAARNGRNPRTGEPIKVQKTTVPAFRPGTSFKTLVAGGGNGGSRQSKAQSQSKSQPRAHSGSQSQPRGQSQRAQSQGQRAQFQGRAGGGRQQSAYGGRQQTAYAKDSSMTVRKPTSHAKGR